MTQRTKGAVGSPSSIQGFGLVQMILIILIAGILTTAVIKTDLLGIRDNTILVVARQQARFAQDALEEHVANSNSLAGVANSLFVEGSNGALVPRDLSEIAAIINRRNSGDEDTFTVGEDGRLVTSYLKQHGYYLAVEWPLPYANSQLKVQLIKESNT